MATKFKNVPFGTEVPTITANPVGSGNKLDLQGFDIYSIRKVWGVPEFYCGILVTCGGGISVTGTRSCGNAILVSGGGDIVVQDGGAFRACGTTYIGLRGNNYSTVVLDNTFQVGCGSVFSVTPTEARFSDCAEVSMFSAKVSSGVTVCGGTVTLGPGTVIETPDCGGVLVRGAGLVFGDGSRVSGHVEFGPQENLSSGLAEGDQYVDFCGVTYFSCGFAAEGYVYLGCGKHLCGATAYLCCGSTFNVECGSMFNVGCGSTFNVGCGSTFCGDLTGTITFGCGFLSSVGAHSVDFYYPPTFHCGSSLFCCGVIGFSADADRSSDSFLAVYSDGSSVSGQGFSDPSKALVAFSMSSSDGLVIENRYNGIQLKSSCGSLSVTVGSTTLELTEDALKTLKTKIGA